MEICFVTEYLYLQACKDHVCADLSPYQNHGQFSGEKCVAWDIKVNVFIIFLLQMLHNVIIKENE